MFNSINKFIIIFLIALVFCNKVFATDMNLFNIPLRENVLSPKPVPSKPAVKDFQNKSIRVLLSDRGSFEHKKLILSSEDEIFVTSANALITNSTVPITISLDGDYFLVDMQGNISKVLTNEKLLITTKNKPIVINNLKKTSKTASYKGNLEISLSPKNNIRVINILDIEDYIKGVVPNEMPVWFGLEALKAQAVSARGYAYRDATYKVSGYDVCDTTGSQVYNGASSYDAISNKAVDETYGQFALYDGKIILSLYSSTAGGYTENYENVFSMNGKDTKFPGNPIPYLKGVPDFANYPDLSKEGNATDFYKNKPDSFDSASPRYRWEYEWKIEDLENILANNLIKNSTSKFVTPSIKSKSEFGKIKDIDIPKRGVSGKAMYVRITTDRETFLIAKEIMIRRIFQHNNKWLPSANIVFEKIKDGRRLVGFKVIGGGFGHGVGLSQFGAYGMAKKGYKYDAILQHYYTGISIGSYPVECNGKNINNCKSTFWANSKNGKLIIKVPSKIQNLTFRINNTDVLLSTDEINHSNGKIEINNYLKKGTNSVELIGYNNGMLDFSNHKVKFYVELAGKNEK